MRALILLCIVAAAFASEECGKNEHYNSCGTACPVTCENYLDPPEVCIKICVPGCHCDAGYVRKGNGQCVKPTECDDTPLEKNCIEKPDSGMCRGAFPMYYYDPKTQTCEKFIYGGCQGNGNRYASHSECMESCSDTVTWDSDSICNLPAETGLCRGFFPRYYFDTKTGKCTRFVYGGCGGNENNFETEEECNQNCGRKMAPMACMQDKVVGPCKANFERFYFNKDAGKCEAFVYGGCNGNSNNFNSLVECENVCLK